MASVTVCVPVYNAAAFLTETLDRIAAQSFADLKVLISLDRSEDESEAICRRYLRDPRFELIVQPARLGWVGNVNALIQRVDTPYFCIAPHDDLPDPRYVAEMHARASSDPAIACVYSDIQGFGAWAPRIEQAEICGPKLARVTEFLLNHTHCVAFRGLVRRSGPDDRPCLPTELSRDFAADTVWMLDIALRGELRRVPEALCAKRFHEASVHAGWGRWSREERLGLWAEQAAVCVRRALAAFDDPEERATIVAAGLLRVRGEGNPESFAAPKTSAEVATAMATFCGLLPEVVPRSSVEGLLASPRVRRLRASVTKNPWRAAKLPLFARIRRRVRRLLG